MPSKTKIFDIAYLTHSVKTYRRMGIPVHVKDKPLTIGQMFFKPYESSEFEYPTSHTCSSGVLLGLTIATSHITLAVPIIAIGAVVSAAALMAAWGGIDKLCGNEEKGSFALYAAEELIRSLCQVIIDLFITPLAVLIMITRGISTGLQAVGFYGEDNMSENGSPPICG